jgi:copper chaperone CopZ
MSCASCVRKIEKAIGKRKALVEFIERLKPG